MEEVLETAPDVAPELAAVAAGPVAAPPGCPVRGYAPFDHDGMHPFFDGVRAETPIFWSEALGYWVLTRRDDILSVLRAPQNFSAEIATQPLAPWPQAALDLLKSRNFTNMALQVACDPPRHSHFRAISQGFLNQKNFLTYEDRFRALVHPHIAAIEARLAAGEAEIDLVDACFYEFPAQVVFELLGETGFDPRQIKKWGDLRLNMIWGAPSEAEAVAAAGDLADFWDYTVGLVAQRAAKPGADYPSYLLGRRGGDDSVMTANEIASLLFGLLLAGHETTTNAAGNLFLTLMRNRAEWEKLVADPSLIPGAVEEGLRYAASVVAWRRTAKVDQELCGQKVKAGDRILLAFASAGRDEGRFEDPGRFDVTRKNAKDHLAFGNGIHFCLGAPLARLELKILLEAFTARFPTMRLSPEHSNAWTRTISFRGPDRVLVRPEG